MKRRAVRLFTACVVLLLGLFLPGARGVAGESAVWRALPDSSALATGLRLPRPRIGEGGGGAVGGLKASQFAYSEEDRDDQGLGVNLLLLEWQVSGSSDLISVFANGAIVTDIFGNPLILAGTETFVILFGGPDIGGNWTFTIEAGGSTSSDDLLVLTSQPFDDPATSCRGGALNPQGACDLIVTISAARKPSFYLSSIDGGDFSTEEIPGTSTEHAIPGLVRGQRCVTLLGFLVQNGNDYIGDPVETCCDFQCEDLPCDPPDGLSHCQHGFGPGDADNKVLVSWANGEPDYAEIRPSVDGKALDPIPGDATSLELAGLAPGEHLLSLEADCGPQGKSPPAELLLTIVPAAPAVEPARNISCRFPSPSATTLVVTWTTVDRPSEVEVYLVAPDDVRTKVKTLPGAATSATIDGTTSADRVGLRFLYALDGLCFSSDVLVCTPSPPPAFKFTRADCDGSSALDLTDGIFPLNFLFRGGTEPPCEAACDANSDGRFDLADPVYTLNYLFLSGPAPASRRPQCDETEAGQACSRSTCS
jgi:hypothetical protein